MKLFRRSLSEPTQKEILNTLSTIYFVLDFAKKRGHYAFADEFAAYVDEQKARAK